MYTEPSDQIIRVITDLFKAEGVKSVSDFGVEVGQYKAGVLKITPDLTYYAYDGAGNIEEYTKGVLSHFDLSLPLSVPKTEWLISLEVGEHIPSRFEGMVIRNLHRHNYKGIIISWGRLGQNGHKHIDNHSNEHITKVFEQLGYAYDNQTSALIRKTEDRYHWLQRTVMVFRRLKSIAC